MKTMSASKKQFVEMHNVKAFVVPNPASRMTLGNVQDLPAYCVDKKKKNDIYVEVWITSDEYDNVACHGGPISWSFFPESLFKGKKEGDVIKIGKYDVTLQQTGFRYQSFGRFENVLEKVLIDRLRYERK